MTNEWRDIAGRDLAAALRHQRELADEVEALREALLQGMNALIELVGAHGEISAWPEWDACSHFVHDNSHLVAAPDSGAA